MATTISSAFETLKSNLEITGLQRSTVSTRQTKVRAAIEDDMEVLDSFLSGSYIRNTMIAPLGKADIDIFIVLDAKYYEADGQASLLDNVRRVLLKTYPKTPKISRNGQAVTITFTDFMVDVVPAFHRQGGGYLIPDTLQNRWLATNPKTHIDLVRQENAVHGGDLVPIVKMIKGWNRNTNDAFVSFYLELLAIKIFTNVTISDYPSGMRFFFDKGREAIRYKVPDLVPYGGQVGGLRNVTTVEQAQSRFQTAFNRARTAELNAGFGDIEVAIDGWRKIFGDYFPAYG
jgi:hypothetical protein